VQKRTPKPLDSLSRRKIGALDAAIPSRWRIPLPIGLARAAKSICQGGESALGA